MKRRIVVTGIGIGAILLLLGQSFGCAVNSVSRNSYGDGEKKEQFYVSIDGVLEREEVTLEIPERSYTAEEIQKIFAEMTDALDQEILNGNPSKDEVRSDLYLPEFLEGYPVEILWEVDRYDIMDATGKILEEKLPEKGTLLELRGVLKYQSYEAMYITNVCVFPQAQTEEEFWISELEKAFLQQETLTKEEKDILLPKELSGKAVRWEKKPDYRIFSVLGLGVLFGWIWKLQKKQDEKQAEEKKREQMRLDYPDIVSTFALLLGTGMTVKSTWNKIVGLYEADTTSEKNRFAYEEMCLTSREMKGGISELEAYERFGKRCSVSCYTKFSMLLAQNLRKGSKGLTELLKMESLQAWEQRKSRAKKRGEEASAKMLLPMFIMFAVVLLMIMVPAFLSIQI